MRFRGTFAPRGLGRLEKSLLPTLEKFGKTCQVLLGPEEVKFVQTAANTDGTHVAAWINTDVLFEPDSLRLVSRHHNLIAFTLDVGLLLKVLRSAIANHADFVEVKLAQKAVDVPGEDSRQRPFLCFSARAEGCSLGQDLPISSPYGAAEIDHLVRTSSSSEDLCGWYLDVGCVRHRLQPVVDKMRGISSQLKLVLCKNGDVHLQASSTNVLLGSQFQDLSVLPADQRLALPAEQRGATAEEQLQAVLDGDQGMAVQVLNKHLLRVFAASSTAEASQILCGLSPDRGFVHVMYVFSCGDGSAAAFDDSQGLSFKLPTLDE